MDDSDDEEYAFYGTPLDPIEEDEVVRKRPITVEEMEATDKQGRKRFHGAFTGGFSAGFYNTVGSLEGWKPTTFKSSRSERGKFATQTPDDFMDDEDTEEFGIAPKSLQAKPEYGGGKKRQREIGLAFHSGPIPGEPVLQSILKPARETVGMLLLIKMGWRPGQGVGPKLTRLQRRAARVNRAKVYSCALQPEDLSSEDSDDELVSPEDLLGVEKPMPKEDTAGLGYIGLTRPEIFPSAPAKPFTFVDANNRRLAIAGQAFGVGAFEEEDECIYSTDDKSNYDFSLEPISSGKKKSRFSEKEKKSIAITDGSNVLPGFVEAKDFVRKKFFPPPELPPGYVPIHQIRKSRFDPEPAPIQKNLQVRLDATSRAAIIDSNDRVKSESDLEAPTVPMPEPGWRPFAAWPDKQERYEKFLHFIKIGAKDAFKRVQPHTMTDLERERELAEFETSAKLYTPLAGFMRERFTHGGVKEEPDVKIESSGKMERLIITTDPWYPHDLVCKRFNIPNPHGSSGEMLKAAKETKNRKKFNLFDFLSEPADEEKKSSSEISVSSSSSVSANAQEETVAEEMSVSLEIPHQVSGPENLFDEDPPKKMDLYKAIFESSDEEENAEEPVPSQTEPVVNVLRNTSPPRGIFANLDLDEINKRVIKKPEKPQEPDQLLEKSAAPTSSKSKASEKSESRTEVKEVNTADMYGPALPSKPLFTKAYKNVQLDIDDGMWVEKTSEEIGKSKHKHKHKKHKKESKRKKGKHKKKKGTK